MVFDIPVSELRGTFITGELSFKWQDKIYELSFIDSYKLRSQFGRLLMMIEINEKLEWWRANFKKYGANLKIFSFGKIGLIYFGVVFGVFFVLILLVSVAFILIGVLR